MTALLVPATFLVTSVLEHRPDGLRRARFASLAALAVAALALPTLSLVPAVMLGLVTALGAAITWYSRSYLAGDPGVVRYERWLLVTLAAVSLLVVAEDLLLLAFAWTATGVSLHQLLTHQQDRTAALVAAHKKFIVSRIADVFLWSAIALVSSAVGSTRLDALGPFVGAHPELPLSLQAAAVCFVVAAALKSAQLPFHGWLTQVMEAPTPVSALLHAGVVNIGGFLMVRLSPLMAAAPGAQALLLTIGLVTTVVAALVMTTRVSIKLALAWSTIAQMGFMLVQCSLGAWHLALLHLVAHSLYKAHAFLSSGSTVEAWKVRALTPRRAVGAADVVIALVISTGVTAAVALGAHALGAAGGATELPLAALLGLGLVSLNLRATAGDRAAASLVGMSVVVGVLTAAWHALAARALPVPPAPGLFAWALVVLAFAGVLSLQLALRLRPGGALARRLHPWLFGGLFLDEAFTRLTFRAWPPRLPKRASAPAVRRPSSVEA
jgi:NAD(P)H-quinone oxidoreductase subunit 5